MKITRQYKKHAGVLLMLVATEVRSDCYWCGKNLRTCGTCRGRGLYKEKTCPACNGSGLMCPTHGADWN